MGRSQSEVRMDEAEVKSLLGRSESTMRGAGIAALQRITEDAISAMDAHARLDTHDVGRTIKRPDVRVLTLTERIGSLYHHLQGQVEATRVEVTLLARITYFLLGEAGKQVESKDLWEKLEPFLLRARLLRAHPDPDKVNGWVHAVKVGWRPWGIGPDDARDAMMALEELQGAAMVGIIAMEQNTEVAARLVPPEGGVTYALGAAATKVLAERDKLRTRVEQLERQMIGARDAVAAVRKVQTNLEVQVADLERERDHLTGERDGIKAVTLDLRSERDALQARVADLDAQRSVAETNLAKSLVTINRLQRERDALQVRGNQDAGAAYDASFAVDPRAGGNSSD